MRKRDEPLILPPAERGGRLRPDDYGVDLPDAEAAFEEALLGARGLMDDAALGGQDVSASASR